MNQNASSTIGNSNDNLIELNDARNYLRKSHGDIYLAAESALESQRSKYMSSKNINNCTSTAVVSCDDRGDQISSRKLIYNNNLQLDAGDDEDAFYSPDEDAIDSFICKWKNERLNSSDSEIHQLFQLSFDERVDRKEQSNKKDENVKSPFTHKSDIDCLRNYLIKKYFGSEDALNSVTASEVTVPGVTSDGRNAEEKSNLREDKMMQVATIDEIGKSDTSSASSNNAKSAVVSNDDKSSMNTDEDDDVPRDIEEKACGASVKTLSENKLSDDEKQKADQTAKIFASDTSEKKIDIPSRTNSAQKDEGVQDQLKGDSDVEKEKNNNERIGHHGQPNGE